MGEKRSRSRGRIHGLRPRGEERRLSVVGGVLVGWFVSSAPSLDAFLAEGLASLRRAGIGHGWVAVQVPWYA